MAIPDLSGSGYRFMCGRLVATAYQQAALHMYDEDHGTRLVMLARTMATEQNAKMSPLAQVAINGFAWVDHDMGYSFVESPPTEALHPMPMRRAARSPPTPRASGCALNGARPSPRRRARDPSGGVEAACDRLSVPLGHRAHRRRGSAAAASPPRSSERRPLLKLASHRACRG